MGDHRVTLKIQFSMHGHEDKWDSWLNWSDELPDRVADWIREQKEKAMDNWFAENEDSEARAAAEVEAWEREELARLQAKYGAPSRRSTE